MGGGRRILHLISSSRWTGVAEPATSLAACQHAHGHTVWMACQWGGSLEERLLARELPLARAVNLQRHYSPISLWFYIRALKQFILSQRVEVVHCHLLHDHWLAAAALRNVPGEHRPLLVRTVHRYEKPRSDTWHRWLFSTATELVITVSIEQKKQLLEIYPVIINRLRVIFGGVDGAKFRPDLPGASSVRADLGEPVTSRVAGIVAHLGYNRGHRWLMKAIPRVLDEVPEAVFWIVGRGELWRELRRRAREPRFKNRLIMAGYRRDDLPEAYAAMDVALFLGLGSEGSARAVLEAMASGCPVVGLKKGALLDTISHGYNGFLVPENDVNALAESLIRVLSNPERCKEMGAAARETVLQSFTEEKRYLETMQAYEASLASRKPGLPSIQDARSTSEPVLSAPDPQ